MSRFAVMGLWARIDLDFTLTATHLQRQYDKCQESVKPIFYLRH